MSPVPYLWSRIYITKICWVLLGGYFCTSKLIGLLIIGRKLVCMILHRVLLRTWSLLNIQPSKFNKTTYWWWNKTSLEALCLWDEGKQLKSERQTLKTTTWTVTLHWRALWSLKSCLVVPYFSFEHISKYKDQRARIPRG